MQSPIDYKSFPNGLKMAPPTVRPIIQPGWYKNCSNSASLITLEDWKDDPQIDYIRIYGRTSTGDLIENPICHNRQNMIKVMDTQVFADWVPSPDYETAGQVQTIDNSGYGGKPGNKRFYKTTIQNLIDYDSYLLLKDPSIRDYVREIKLLNQRIGNLRGSFGPGQQHGQLPGFTIYSLRAKPQ